MKKTIEALKRIPIKTSLREPLQCVHYTKDYTEAIDSYVFARLNFSFLEREGNRTVDELFFNVGDMSIKENVAYPDVQFLIEAIKHQKECPDSDELVFCEKYEDLYASIVNKNLKIEPKFLKKVHTFIKAVSSELKVSEVTIFSDSRYLYFRVGDTVAYAVIGLIENKN